MEKNLEAGLLPAKLWHGQDKQAGGGGVSTALFSLLAAI